LIGLFSKRTPAEEQVSRLFMDTYPNVVRYCYHIVHEADEAADLAQEAFSRLYTSFDALGDPTKIKSYLYSTARNVCISRLRARQKEATLRVEYERFRALDPGDPPWLREQQYRIVEALIEELPSAREKELVKLYYFGELTTRELAERIGMPHGTVTVTLQRVRTKLLKRLVLAMGQAGERPT
jgi:RNA polymerase sigma-70 factor, ECF subfamily